MTRRSRCGSPASGIWRSPCGSSSTRGGHYQSPGFGDVCNNLGFAYWTLREFKKAEEVLLRLREILPGALHDSAQPGRRLPRHRPPKEAMERYQHFLEMEGGTPAQRKAAEKSLERLKGRP